MGWKTGHLDAWRVPGGPPVYFCRYSRQYLLNLDPSNVSMFIQRYCSALLIAASHSGGPIWRQ